MSANRLPMTARFEVTNAISGSDLEVFYDETNPQLVKIVTSCMNDGEDTTTLVMFEDLADIVDAIRMRKNNRDEEACK